MCTVSWCHHAPGSYALFFNRDESKTRLPAIPPRQRSDNGVVFLSPADGDHGGTWLVVNAHGLSVGILNHYEAGERYEPDAPTSRGQLVLSLAGCLSPEAVGENVERLDPTRYRPFLLFAVAPEASPQMWVWDGNSLQQHPPALPLTTSSYQSEAVVAYRQNCYHQLGENPTPEQLAGFHRSHDPAQPRFSVRLRRENTQTVSHSRIDVSPEEITFSHRPEPDESLSL